MAWYDSGQQLNQKFIKGSVLNIQKLSKAIKGSKIVLNFAALADMDAGDTAKVVIYIGGGPAELSINFSDLLSKDITIKGNSVYSIASYYEEVEFLFSLF